jgi:peptidoglycan-associated lipoprotein
MRTPVRTEGRSWRAEAFWLLALVMTAVLAGACSRKVPTPGQEGVGGGIADQGLGGAGSLDRAREGLGPDEGGPLQDVHFPFDSDDLDEVARGTLDSNLTWIRDNPKARVEIEGHCDNRGTVEYNLALGARRAKAVQDYLVTQGIAGNRLTTISYGKELPLCQEETEECWARNRRAHSVVLGQ